MHFKPKNHEFVWGKIKFLNQTAKKRASGTKQALTERRCTRFIVQHMSKTLERGG
jgi:hypothetical protein